MLVRAKLVQLLRKLALSITTCTFPDPTVPLPGISPAEALSQAHQKAGMRMFTEVLFLIAENGKPFMYPTTIE